MKEEITISLMDLLSVLAKRLKWLILAFVIGALLAWSVTNFLITPQYTSYVNMYVDNGYTDVMVDSGTPVINTSALEASQELVNTYSVLLTDMTFLDSVSQELDGRVTAAQLRGAISIQSVEDTVIMQVAATTPDPQLSADICDAVGELAPDMLKRVIKAGSTVVMGDAPVPIAPSSPNVLRNTVLGALIALVLVAGIFIMVEVLDTTIRSDEKLKSKFDVAFLGSVPSQTPAGMKNGKNANRAQLYPRMKITDKTPFKVTEAYKTIRTNLMFTMSTSSNKAIEITSANPSECKSVTTANLAITMAQTGARVLLIDADMRRPVQHKVFGVDNTRGLSNVLAGMNELNACVKQNVIPNLDVFTAGPIPPNPAELIGSQNMKVLIDALNEYYDIILIDTPPVGVVTDALAMSQYTGGILLMTRQNSTKIGDLENAIAGIETVDGNLLGVILTDVDPKSLGYSYKNKYSYSTYEHEAYGPNANSK